MYKIVEFERWSTIARFYVSKTRLYTKKGHFLARLEKARKRKQDSEGKYDFQAYSCENPEWEVWVD